MQALLEGTPSSSSSQSQSIGKKAGLLETASKKHPATTAAQLLRNPLQLRMAMREMCHQWASAVQEQAVKIHVLQR